MMLWQYPGFVAPLCYWFGKYLCGMQQHPVFEPDTDVRCCEMLQHCKACSQAEAVKAFHWGHGAKEGGQWAGDKLCFWGSHPPAELLLYFFLFTYTIALNLPSSSLSTLRLYEHIFCSGYFLHTAQTAGATILWTLMVCHKILLKISKN